MTFRAKPPKHVIGDETRQLLLDAATDVFIDVGFRAARVQDIANAAGVRLSAINYHFGSKEGLYFAVLQYHAEIVIRAKPLAPATPEQYTLEQRFRFFIHSLVSRVLDPDSPSKIARLLVREASNPTTALDMLFEHFISQQYSVLHELLLELFGDNTPSDVIAQTAVGIVGQVIVYAALQPLVSKIRPAFYGDTHQLYALTEHVADFSWAGLQSLLVKQRKTS